MSESPTTMTIRAFLRDVYFVERSLSPSTLHHHEYSLRCLERFLCREATLDDLEETLLNRWLVSMQDRGLADSTIKGRRIDAIGWWNMANDQEPPLVERHCRPRKIRRIKLGRRNPNAWRLDEIIALIETADELRGVIRSLECAKKFYWGSLFRAVWDTALRRCDLCSIKYADIQRRDDGGGLLVIQQSKTGDDVIVQFSADTMQAVDRMMQMSEPRELCWPLFARLEQFYKALREIVAAAGVRPGTYKWFRRSSITARERITPGLGQLAAGHSTPDMARRHYIDRSQLDPVPLPPSIGTPKPPAAPARLSDPEPGEQPIPRRQYVEPPLHQRQFVDGNVIFSATFIPGGDQ